MAHYDYDLGIIGGGAAGLTAAAGGAQFGVNPACQNTSAASCLTGKSGMGARSGIATSFDTAISGVAAEPASSGGSPPVPV